MVKAEKDPRRAPAVTHASAKLLPFRRTTEEPVEPVSREGGVRIGRLVRTTSDGHAWVEIDDGHLPPYSLKCALTGPLTERDLQTELIVWEHASGLGIVLGREPRSASSGRAPRASHVGPIAAQVDGRRVVVEAEEELVLSCGAASITLRANGRVLIRGTHVETSAEGVNRIKGGSVQIN